jgi:hypothetical protein
MENPMVTKTTDENTTTIIKNRTFLNSCDIGHF